MFRSRREFLAGAAGAAAAVGVGPLALPTMAEGKEQTSPQAILSLFKSLPGDVAIKIQAPAANGKPEFLVESNSSKQMFVGSAIKTFVLCEALRQADSPQVVKTLTAQQLALDASVWSLDSATFNPPNLIGKVSERTALEAMIMHSDNTGTDMCLKHVGPDKVREFIASAGLNSVMVPESTRVFFGYLLGAKNYKAFTWEEIGAAANQSIVNSPMNKVESLAASADDFVSYYSRALQGQFFHNKETLNEFRRILSMGDAIWLVPLPLGVSAFVKGGSVDVPGYHALCVPGGMLFDDRWVYFCLTINWNAAAETDPNTVSAFAAACSRALALVKDALSA
ncbi:MAG: serine hydrolase [Candidatus Korobacteraceae bacterium]